MSNATKKPEVGHVTIATVGSDEEAQPVTAALDAGGIKWTKTKERSSPREGAAKRRLAGIKIQVSASDARRAVQLLSEKGSQEPPSSASPRGGTTRAAPRRQFGAHGWTRSAIEVIALVAAAGLVAVLVFY